jgi:DNA-binding CsgD family transcriptional regulator
MSKSARLRLSDLRNIHDLVGDCRALGDDARAWALRLAAGLGRLTGAMYAGAMEATFRAGRLTAAGAGEWGELDWDTLHRVRSGCVADLRFSPLFDRYLARPRPADGEALALSDVVGRREWCGSAYYRDVHEPCRFGHTLTSILAVPGVPGVPGQCSGLMLARAAGTGRDFTAREKAVVREANAALAPLIGGPLAGSAEPRPSALAPRTRAVLRCLLEGDGDKQVAARLRISAYAVNAHTKAIYRHFGVRGRAELLARWVRRGWGSRCIWADE